jgi:hypothetical protein
MLKFGVILAACAAIYSSLVFGEAIHRAISFFPH